MNLISINNKINCFYDTNFLFFCIYINFSIRVKKVMLLNTAIFNCFIYLSMVRNYLYKISLLATSITGRTPTKTSVLCTSIL